ncbi:MAG: hypothetical protein JWN48_384 [Myxococcaceae bacterium]|nr:hypothetical protein [Myxococcaceae bacterium]
MIKALTGSLAAAVAVGLLALAPVARAQQGDPTLLDRNARGALTVRDDAAGFGTQGQWAFSSDAAISVQRQTQSDSPGAITTVTLAPAADYFIVKNVSVGGAVALDYRKAGDLHGTRFTIGPRVGYNFEVSRLLSVWPKLGFSYAHTNQDYRRGSINGLPTNATASNGSNAIALNIFVPVMIHPAPHFFAGFGPFVDTDLSGDNRATVWGFRLTLGGWVNKSST